MQHNIDITIWGRAFKLDLVKQVFGDEQPTEIQEAATNWLMDNKDVFDSVKEDVFKYINKEAEVPVSSDENIFKYVVPKAVYIPKKQNRVVALMCDYKFDFEHGMAIVFEEEKLKEIGVEDIIL